MAGFLQYVQGLKVGSGLDASSNMGPLANPRRLAAMAGGVHGKDEAKVYAELCEVAVPHLQD